MRLTKDQKAITLIALVITIIVLLILAGVALATLTGNTSIIDNANNAVERYNASAGNDQNVINQVENLFAKYLGGEIKDTAYEIGDEVSITVNGKTESFYVLEDSDENTSTVTLLAKYNLDKDADTTTGKYYQKADAFYSDTACGFSSTAYWETEWNAIDAGELNTETWTYENAEERMLDLNDETEYGAAESGSALDRAKNYATNTIGSGAIGRLLTYEEANSLKDSYGDMIYGRENQQRENTYFLDYWLSTTSGDYSADIYCIGTNDLEGEGYGQFEDNGSINTIPHYLGEDARYCFSAAAGVRPVITISKDYLDD